MQQAAPGTLGSQWVPCDGRHVSVKVPMAPTPHSGRSKGTVHDYYRNVGRHGGALGILPFAGNFRVPRDTTAGNWYVSIADHSGETTLTNPPTVLNPPAGVR
jgi:hypothetical protein